MKINNSNRELGTAAITTHVTETIGTVNVAVKLPGTNQDTLVTALNRRQTARTLCTAGLGEIASATSESLHTGDDDGVGVRLLSTGTKFEDIVAAQTLSEINAGIVCNACNIADNPETNCKPPGSRTDV